jgi:type II secretory pathway component GspD/PulD (secretin)
MRRRSTFRSRLPFLVGFGAVALLAIQLAEAQLGDVRRAPIVVGRSSGGGLIGTALGESARAELKLTEDQISKVQSLSQKSRPSRDFLQPFFDQMRATKSNDERLAIQVKMRDASTKWRRDVEAELDKVLSKQQLARLQQLTLHNSGARALTSDAVAANLKLTDQQKEQLAKLSTERSDAGRNLRFRGTQEERDKFGKEWDGKMLALLTADQRKGWVVSLGPPPIELAQQTTQPAEKPAPTDPAKTKPGETKPEGDKPEVASFGGDSPGKGKRPEHLQFNFRQARWDIVLEMFAEAAGLSLDLNTKPSGTFSYYDNAKYTPTEALDILNGYLLQQGHVLVKRDRFLVVVNIDEGIPPNLVPDVAIADLPKRGKNELMRIVLPLEGIDVEEAANEVDELVGPQGKVVALKTSNSLAIQDIGSNLRLVVKLLSDVTVQPDPNAMVFRAFPLRYIAVAEGERIVRSQLGLESSSVRNVSESYDSRSSSRSSSSSRTPPASPAPSGKAQVTPDPRTNSLLVTATAAQLDTVEQVLKVVDVAEGPNGRPILQVGDDIPYLQVYTVSQADPREVTKTLDVIRPGVVVNEDGRYKTIHIYATTEQHRDVAALIRQLDGGSGAGSVAVLPLARMDALTAAATVRAMFISDGDRAPTVEPHPMGRGIMVRGSADQVAQIKTLLTQLGENGTGVGSATAGVIPRQSGPVRTLSLGGRDPEEFIQLLDKVWSRSGRNPLRIVVPNRRGPIDERRTPTKDPTKPETKSKSKSETEEPQPNKTNSEDDKKTTARRNTRLPVFAAGLTQPVSAQADADDAPAKQSADQSKKPAPAEPKSQGVPIVISISDGNLVLSSSDTEALDQLELLIESLAQAMPVRTTWTVFYLRAADATECATMLEQLFPTSNVSMTADSSGSMLGGLTGGLSSFGSSLMDMTGLSGIGAGAGALTLRIIPEARSNALFVSGPAAKIREVEQVLKILDSSELPESLRDRVPRTILVEHADVDDVAKIVQDIYKDYMQSERAAPSRGGNPLQMLMAGGGGSSGGRSGSSRGGQTQAQSVRLTIGVDNNTNRLIVSASESLYLQVEALVKSLDDAAHEANRTIRIMPVNSANAAIIQQGITSLIPKVTVSTTGSSRSASRPTSSRPTSGAPQQGGGQSGDDVRRFFEERIRQRLQQGGGGGGGRPGGGSSGGSSGGRPGGGSGGRSSSRGDR